jgi:hypothetical protein
MPQVQKVQAKEETEEAIQAGNHRYNAMLHERMTTEDRLNEHIGKLKLEIAGKERERTTLSRDMEAAAAEGAASLSRQVAAWQDERHALQCQMDQVLHLPLSN